MLHEEGCLVCGGDGRIHNSFGLSNTCPACHGSGRRSEGIGGFRDVTKTKPSHFRKPVTPAEEKAKRTTPSTPNGLLLASEVQATKLSAEIKERLIREIIEYEGVHASCTKTFMTKLRKKLRPGADT